VPFVLVYGTIVIDHGNHTGARSGEYGAGKSSAAVRGAAQANAENRRRQCLLLLLHREFRFRLRGKRWTQHWHR
jgi:hypothetical protein